ncbi:MAG: hypothetical protein PHD43_05465 [Methylococcales bacterium]|nr:hypothetical protein [Methylococcales bacterium]
MNPYREFILGHYQLHTNRSHTLDRSDYEAIGLDESRRILADRSKPSEEAR